MNQEVSHNRLIFWLIAAGYSMAIWLSPRPPMVDLPQHVAQVTALRDMAQGSFLWNDLVHVDLRTPYLLMYVLATPLSFLAPAVVSLKIVVSMATLLYFWLLTLLRRELEGDEELDPLMAFGVCGLAWWWGFVNFIISLPLAICFILCAYRHARHASLRSSGLVLLTGAPLLLSHGLAFLYASGVGVTFQLMTRTDARQKLRGLAPFGVLFMLGFILFYAMTPPRPDLITAHDFNPMWRLSVIFRLISPDSLIAAAAMATPLLFGRLRTRLEVWVPLLATLTIFLLLSRTLNGVSLPGERFAMLLPPFWALTIRLDRKWAEIVFSALSLCAGASLWFQVQRQQEFNLDSRTFESVLSAAEPGRRALSIVNPYATTFSAPFLAPVYLHYPVWYQVEKRGFVDFNFAYFFNNIVQFRPGKEPSLSEATGWTRFHLPLASELRNYNYIFVHGDVALAAAVMNLDSGCTFETRKSAEKWFLLERTRCHEPSE